MSFVENQSRWAVDARPSMDARGRDLTLFNASATFLLPPAGAPHGGKLQPCEQQPAPRIEDEYWGEPATSSLRYETQTAYTRPGTDIYINGSAHAPGRKAVKKMAVRAQVGPCDKSIAVIGTRVWHRSVGISASDPLPFERLPLRYERAFGGAADSDAGQEPLWEPRNPVGRGLYRSAKEACDQPLPNLEDPKQRIGSWDDRPAPTGLGPIARSWQPRISFAGTYDEAWVAQRAPLWARDFDERFFCAAAAGMTSRSYLGGGEPVLLEGMHPEGLLAFALPTVRLMVESRYRDRRERRPMLLDAVLIEPDEGRLTLTWRATLPQSDDGYTFPSSLIRELAPGEVCDGSG